METVENLSLEERRKIIYQEIKKVHQELGKGKVKFGSVDKFLEELDK